MKQNTILAAVSLALVAASMSAAIAAGAAQPATAGQPNADTILRQMSDKLSAASQFSFKATREIDAALAAGRGLQAQARIEVVVRRPNAVFGRSMSKDGVRYLYFDGNTLSIFDAKRNMYATVPMRTSLDALPVQLATRYGFVPPLAEFVISNPYKDISWRAQTISYAGTGTYRTGFLGLSQVKCYRIALSGKFADSELWIAVNDQLPRRMTARLKGQTGATALDIEFLDWNLNAPVTTQEFVFTPPKGASEIPIQTALKSKR